MQTTRCSFNGGQVIKTTLLLATILICSTALVAEASGAATPLSRCDVLAYQSLSGEGQRDLLALFQNPGIAFDVTDNFVRDFTAAGSSPEIITALRNAVHSDARASFSCGKPLYNHVLAAASAYAARSFIQSESEWRSAVALEPANPMLHLALGTILGLEKKWPQAEQEHRTAVSLNPNLALAHSRLAAALTVLAYSGSREQRLQQAHQQFERAVQLSPDDCLLRANFAITLLSQGDYAYADKQLESAERQCPKMTFPMYVRANSLAEQGQHKEAVAQLRSALELQPGNCQISRYLASLLSAHGDAEAQKASAEADRVCSSGARSARQKH
jgi:tetratricopeptide (TPR) repeat protein